MRIPRAVVRLTLTPLVLGACSLTEPEAYGMWFDLNGRPDSTFYVQAIYHGLQRRLTLTAVEALTSGQLELELTGYSGATRSYAIDADQGASSIFPPGTVAYAALQRQDGYGHDMGGFAGSGRIGISEFRCYRTTGADASGAPATYPVCAVTGTFDFAATGSGGDPINVTNGHFHVVALKY